MEEIDWGILSVEIAVVKVFCNRHEVGLNVLQPPFQYFLIEMGFNLLSHMQLYICDPLLYPDNNPLR